MPKTLCRKLITDICDAIVLGEYFIVKRYPTKLQASIIETGRVILEFREMRNYQLRRYAEAV